MKLKTIKKSFTLHGVGLHTGKKAHIHFKRINQPGIYFRRNDIADSPLIPAKTENVISTMRGTSISYDGIEIHTIEHVMSACAGLGITAVEIHIDGPEVPILDSSTKGYTDAFFKSGLKEFPQGLKTLTVKEKIEYRNEDEAKVYYSAQPADKVIIDFTFTSDHPLIKNQQKEFILTPENYVSQIAPCRTFVFYDDIACLQKIGLVRGGSLDNAIVVTKDKYLTAGADLHFEDEPVRHKILDLLGDLALTGHPLENIKITAIHGGHKFNVEFAKILLHKGVIN
jgi:UDP-3-O-acyl N-acetylglucosamine deacetylase